MNAVAEEFIGKFLTELRENNAAVFIGAGLSKAAVVSRSWWKFEGGVISG